MRENIIKIAIFASGNGSNFEALAKHFEKLNSYNENNYKYKIEVLVYDKKDAFVVNRADKFNIESKYVDYSFGKENGENQIIEILKNKNIDIVFLAGFMRILSKKIIDTNIPIINIHPSLLPKYRGINSIERAYNSNDKEIGVTIHYVNERVDEGEIIVQESIELDKSKSLDEIENEVHKIEHKIYPIIAEKLCNEIIKLF
jgi:phosphoribosylglycinamide formyltransferase-1